MVKALLPALICAFFICSSIALPMDGHSSSQTPHPGHPNSDLDTAGPSTSKRARKQHNFHDHARNPSSPRLEERPGFIDQGDTYPSRAARADMGVKDSIDPGFIRRIVIGSYGGGPGGERVFMHKMAERLMRVPHQDIEDDSHHASILLDPQDPDYKLHQFLNSMGDFYRVPHRDPRYQGLTRQSAYRWFGEAKGEKVVQDQEADYRKTYQHSNVGDQDGWSHS